MKVFILTSGEYEREIEKVAFTREAIEKHIVELVLSGQTLINAEIDEYEVDGEPPVIEEPQPEQHPAAPRPKGDDFIIDGGSDRWDYFPHMNQYQCRINAWIPGKYVEGLGYKAAHEIEKWYGIRKYVSNGVDTGYTTR